MTTNSVVKYKTGFLEDNALRVQNPKSLIY